MSGDTYPIHASCTLTLSDGRRIIVKGLLSGRTVRFLKGTVSKDIITIDRPKTEWLPPRGKGGAR